MSTTTTKFLHCISRQRRATEEDQLILILLPPPIGAGAILKVEGHSLSGAKLRKNFLQCPPTFTLCPPSRVGTCLLVCSIPIKDDTVAEN